MRVAILIPTNRPEHIPWWSWQLRKQTRQADEVIVATNYKDPSIFDNVLVDTEDTADLQVVHDPDPTSATLGELRQMALDSTDADVVIWMDDDDWYHPRRIELSVAALESSNYDVAAFPLTHLYYTKTGLLHEFPDIGGYTLPSIACWREAIPPSARFGKLQQAEERPWLGSLLPADMKRVHYETRYLDGNVGGIVLIHGKNTWNYLNQPLHSLGVGRELSEKPPLDVSTEEWVETKRLLQQLPKAP